MITRAELLARLHAPSPATDKPLVIDLSDYAEQYGDRLADMAHRVLSLIRFPGEPRRLLELHPGPVALAAAIEGPKVYAVEPSLRNQRSLAETGVDVVAGRWPQVRPEGRFDLIVAAGVLSAFGEHELQGELAEALHGLLAPGGQLLMLEQANRSGGRAVIAMRAGLLRLGLKPILPCTHAGSCPMSENRKRVCAFAMGEEEPEDAVDPLDRRVSMLLMGRDALPRHSAPLVIGRAKRIDDRVELPVCHADYERLVAVVADHTRRGAGLYGLEPGCYVDLPADRVEEGGNLLPGAPVTALHCLFDDEAP